MYRVYLSTSDQQVMEKTNTHNRAVALAAFAEMVGRTELDGQKLAAVLTYDNKHLAFHRFDRHPGQTDYWRNQLDEIEFPEGCGPTTLDGSQRVYVALDGASLERASELGNGNVSEGIRIALQGSAK